MKEVDKLKTKFVITIIISLVFSYVRKRFFPSIGKQFSKTGIDLKCHDPLFCISEQI